MRILRLFAVPGLLLGMASLVSPLQAEEGGQAEDLETKYSLLYFHCVNVVFGVDFPGGSSEELLAHIAAQYSKAVLKKPDIPKDYHSREIKESDRGIAGRIWAPVDFKDEAQTRKAIENLNYVLEITSIPAIKTAVKSRAEGRWPAIRIKETTFTDVAALVATLSGKHLIFGDHAQAPFTMNPQWDWSLNWADQFDANGQPKAEFVSRACNLRELMKTLKIEDVVTALETAWQIRGHAYFTRLRFHQETKVLILDGPADEIAAADQVFQALTGNEVSVPAPKAAPADNAMAAELRKLSAELAKLHEAVEALSDHAKKKEKEDK